MTYSPSVPQPNQTIASSQNAILENFEQIAGLIANNHVAFNEGDEGKHNRIQVPVFTDTLSPGTAPAEVGIFSKEVSSIARLFFQQENEADTLSGFQISGETPTIADPGNFYLPGGLEVKFGTVNLTGGATSAPILYTGTALGVVLFALGTVNTNVITSNGVAALVEGGLASVLIRRSAGADAGRDVSWIVVGTL